jgi:hypothetical protein
LPERQRAGGEHQHQWAGSRAVHPLRSMVLVISSARMRSGRPVLKKSD